MTLRDRTRTKVAKNHSNWLAIPFLAACACFGLALGSAPPMHAGPADWLSPFLTAAAAVIAALFVGLALGARQIDVSPIWAAFTMAYVALGEAAAMAGLSTGLPTWTYAWLLAITVGSGAGALLSAVIVGGKALAAETEAVREGRVDKLLGDTSRRSQGLPQVEGDDPGAGTGAPQA